MHQRHIHALILLLLLTAFGTFPDPGVAADQRPEPRATDKNTENEKPRRRRRRKGLRGLLRKLRGHGGEKAKVGAPAPDFDLRRLENAKQRATPDKPQQTIRLSSFVDQRPVVLIFGSYT